MVDFTQYQPPGVYVEDDSQPAVVSTSQPGGSLVLVGPGLGYKTYTETVRAYSLVGSATALAQRGVYTVAVAGPPAIPAPVVRRLDGTLINAGEDYDFVIDVSGGGGAANAVTTLVRIPDGGDPSEVGTPSPNGVVDGEQVTITYAYTSTQYYTPQTFDSYDLVADTYGDPLVTEAVLNPNENQVISPLTLAAKVAFENGVPSIICVATDPSDGTMRQQFVAAYAKLLSNSDVGVIVPVFVDGYGTGLDVSDYHTPSEVLGYLSDLAIHLAASATDGFGRIAITGLAKDYDETTMTIDDLAQTVSNKRIVLAYPNRAVVYNGSNNQTTEVDGVYFAVALGAVALSDVVQRSLTRKSVTGFQGIPSQVFQRMTKSFKDTLSKSGVLVIEQNRLGRLWVRHGVTTDMTSMTSREISLIRIADTLFQQIQSGMENSNLIGEPIDVDMLTRVKGALQGILEQVKAAGTITDYNNLSVRQQSIPAGDPTVIECRFAYQPPLPLNYITVSFTIDLTSGTVAGNAVPNNIPTTG